MSDLDPKILAKVKKCLALSASANPHEAATALRQANALMEKHGISTNEITLADIGEAWTTSQTMSRDKPANWEVRLVVVVGKAFGCQLMANRHPLPRGCGHANRGGYIFVGLKHQVEVAAYTAGVLIRKCKSARQKWLRDHFSGFGRGVVGGKAQMTRMGDMFAEGWVDAIGKLVVEFANPPEVETALARLIEERSRGQQAETRCMKNITHNDLVAAHSGMQAASQERLYRPMAADEAQRAIGMVAVT